MTINYKGVNGSVKLTSEGIIIRRRGFLGFWLFGLRGGKSIPFASITAIQFKRAGLFSGYIQFTVKGGNENLGGLWAAMSDENTVLFWHNNHAFEELRALVDQKIAGISSGGRISVADEIAKFATLRDRSVITDDEFARKKRDLLEL